MQNISIKRSEVCHRGTDLGVTTPTREDSTNLREGTLNISKLTTTEEVGNALHVKSEEKCISGFAL
jgi:hypothetical protein